MAALRKKFSNAHFGASQLAGLNYITENIVNPIETVEIPISWSKNESFQQPTRESKPSARAYLPKPTDSFRDLDNKSAVPETLITPDQNMIAQGLSEIGPSPDKLKPAFRKLALISKGLNDAQFLSSFAFLFILDMQQNRISDLSPLSCLKYLVQIDFSNNNLGNEILFKGPYNLQDVNLANNRITDVTALSGHKFLSRLCLDGNMIVDLAPLAKCKNLRELHICGNQIESLEPLSKLPIKILKANENNIHDLEGVQEMTALSELYISDNKIKLLQPLAQHSTLSTLFITNNEIEDIEEVALLSTLGLLRYLSIYNNPYIESSKTKWNPELNFPLHENAFYSPSVELYIIHLIPKLRVLDKIPVTPEHKVTAKNTYDPPTAVSLSIQHVNHQKIQAMHYARIKAEDLLRSKRLCPIVVCGPSGSGKRFCGGELMCRTLTWRLLQEYPHIYGHCISHTTRSPRPGEEHGVHYYFTARAEMEKMNAQGKFVEYVTLFGNHYGTSMDSIDRVTEVGKVCILDLEFEGVVALKKSMLKPKYILIKPPNIDILRERLAQSHRMDVNDPKLKMWIEKARMGDSNDTDYDFTVINGDLEQAYKNFKEYCIGIYWKSCESDD